MNLVVVGGSGMLYIPDREPLPGRLHQAVAPPLEALDDAVVVDDLLLDFVDLPPHLDEVVGEPVIELAGWDLLVVMVSVPSHVVIGLLDHFPLALWKRATADPLVFVEELGQPQVGTGHDAREDDRLPQALAIVGAQDVDDGAQRSHQPGVVTVAHGLGDISKSGIRDLHVPDDPPQHVDGHDAADLDLGPVAILLGDQVGDELGDVGQVVRRRVLPKEVLFVLDE